MAGGIRIELDVIRRVIRSTRPLRRVLPSRRDRLERRADAGRRTPALQAAELDLVAVSVNLSPAAAEPVDPLVSIACKDGRCRREIKHGQGVVDFHPNGPIAQALI